MEPEIVSLIFYGTQSHKGVSIVIVIIQLLHNILFL